MRKFFLFFVFNTLAFTSLLMSQDTIQLNLIKRTFSFPYDSPENDRYKSINPTRYIGKNVFPMDTFDIDVPQGYELSMFKITEPDRGLAVHVALLESVHSENTAFILFDKNRNLNFKDEDALQITYDTLYSVKLSFQGRTKDYEYYLSKGYRGYTDSDKIHYRQLNFYECRYWLKDTLLKAYITSTFYANTIRLDTVLDGEVKSAGSKYEEGDPIEFNGHIIRFTAFDYLEGTINLEVYEDKSKVLSSKEGYQVDMDSIYRLMDQKPDGNHHLLYFWGEWCGPCKENMGKTKAIQKLVEKSEGIEMSYFSFIVGSNSLERTQKYVQENKLSERQYYLSMAYIPRAEKEELVKKGFDNMMQYLRVRDFPTYILLSPEGKVLYRGNNRDNGLMIYLKDLGLI